MVKNRNEKIEILKLLIENNKENYSINKIANIRKINYKSAYNAIQKIFKENIINLENLGNITLCKFNYNFNESVFKAEYQRREELFKNKNFKLIFNRFLKINRPFIMLLFGSYAKKTNVKSSDIDLLIISEEKEPFLKEADLFSLPLHLTIINYDDFVHMIKSTEKNVVKEAIDDNIILVGIEEYYRVIANAK